MVSTMHRSRPATPERWQAALKRALDSGIAIYDEAGTGLSIVTSATNPGVCYATDGATCSCAAAVQGGDPVCQHRALYWHRAGFLDLPAADPEPETAPCRECLGDGYRRAYYGGRLSDWTVAPCHACQSTGQMITAPEPLHRLVPDAAMAS